MFHAALGLLPEMLEEGIAEDAVLAMWAFNVVATRCWIYGDRVKEGVVELVGRRRVQWFGWCHSGICSTTMIRQSSWL